VSSNSVQIRPEAVPIQPNDSLDQVLKRNNLSPDPTTVEAIRRANPSLDLNQLHKHAGEHVYIPKVAGTTVPGSDHLLQIQNPDLARVQLRQDRKDILALQQKSKNATFVSPAVASRHQKALNDVSVASARLETFTPSMSARDVALVDFQLSHVQQIAAPPAVLMHGDSGPVINANRVTSLEQSVQPMRSVLAVTGRPGVTFEDLRREVRVVVTSAGPTQPNPMRVYVLPAAMVDRPGDYPDDMVLSLMRSLTFTKLTTPSSERLVFSDLAIWVGPDNAYDVMLKRLRSGQLSSRPVPIRDSSPPVIQVDFAIP
jgi:hypothetical protein